ncbi:MAG: aspartate-semialdehyde dehydrogenase [Bacteroidetes bacterium]|nr:aspartate-semialdehyde dehydrogenase [Bacteroidota bacterium]MBU1678780.1 aspartate-semialdehyde dehydrogenase [Bacteroidota bacterium]MBU2508234.1 aspartate-semialdehyde dehydrogenase [Bacteroidota bacterium]
MKNKLSVAVLGATGSVGQKFVELLSSHPWFQISEVAASDRSVGKPYAEATNWNMASPLDSKIAKLTVKKCEPNLDSKIIFSGLDAKVAGEIESEFANSGYTVISNARNHRFDKNVPLVIPEVNPEHLALIHQQEWSGAIITNPNCSTIGLTLALKPIFDNFGIESLNVVTMQAISGGGYPGIPSMDILDNVVPFIGGEEVKLEMEPKKILGEIRENEIKYAEFKISAQCNRVPVLDGHLECVQLKLKNKVTPEEVKRVLREFKGLPQKLKLPTAPENPIIYFEEDNYPQPRIHRNLGRGMSVSIGRLRKDSLFDIKFVVLSHNTIRGAAGGTILIAELLKEQGFLGN